MKRLLLLGLVLFALPVQAMYQYPGNVHVQLDAIVARQERNQQIKKWLGRAAVALAAYKAGSFVYQVVQKRLAAQAAATRGENQAQLRELAEGVRTQAEAARQAEAATKIQSLVRGRQVRKQLQAEAARQAAAQAEAARQAAAAVAAQQQVAAPTLGERLAIGAYKGAVWLAVLGIGAYGAYTNMNQAQ